MTNSAPTTTSATTGTTGKFLGSETTTEGIRVRVAPSYLSAQSDPAQGKYLFAYHILIVNDGQQKMKLRSRHWIIVDANGERHEVKGPGVVGQFPDLGPGEKFEYSSGTPLRTSHGVMRGSYFCVAVDGERFEAPIGPFALVAPEGGSTPVQSHTLH